MNDPIAGFIDAICATGLKPPPNIVADGKLRRFPSNGKRGDDSGWYVLHPDGIAAGAFGDWRSGLNETWSASVEREFTPEEKREYRERMESLRRERAAEEQRRHLEASSRAAEIWSTAKEAGEHPYLQSKGIKPHGLRTDGGKLLIPMRDTTGKLCSLQFIDADGGKKFLPGGRVKGAYFAIGKPKDVLCIAEGFATGATIHEATGHAVAVAFNAGNLKPVAEALRAKLPGTKIVICADNDAATDGNPGLTKATEAAQSNGACIAVPDFGADEGTDFNDLQQLRGAEAVRRCIEASTVTAKLATLATLAAPEPLRRPIPDAAPYPLDALGDILGPAARRIHQVVKAPDALCGQSVLAAASLAIQAHADVLIEGRREPLSLWAVSIADSGERKSAVDQIALAAHKEHERQELRRYGEDQVEYAIDLMAHESASRAANKGKDPAAIKHALLDLGPAPKSPMNPLLLVATPTIEGIHKLYKTGQPSLGLFHDDAGEFIGGHAMSKDNRTKSVSGLSRLWDSGEFDRVRAGDGAEKYYGRRFAMHLMMQPVIAESILSDDVMTGQGFLARSLLAWPASTIGTRTYMNVDLSTDPALANYRRVITQHLQSQPTLRDGTRNELEPRTLTLTPEAKERWTRIHDALEADMRDGGDFATIRAWAGKAPAQTLRIAGVLTLIGDPDAAVIQVETIDRAAELMQFSLAEAVRIIGTSQVPAEIKHAEALLAWCHSEGIRLLHSGAALQFGPGSIRTKPAFDAAITELERAGWAASVAGGCELDGAHRRRVWSITGKSE